MIVKNPVVDFRALSNRNFALGCFLSFVTGIGIFSTIYLTPLFLGYVRGLLRLANRNCSRFSTASGVNYRRPVLHHIGQALRPALDHDVRPGLLRPLAMWVFLLHHAANGAPTRAFAAASHPRLSHRYSASPPQSRLGLGQPYPRIDLKYASGLFKHDAQPRRRGRDCGMWRSTEQPHQFPFPDALASNLTDANAPTRRRCCRSNELPPQLQTLGSPVAGHAKQPSRELWQPGLCTQAQTLSYADAFRTIMLAFISCHLPDATA